MATYTIQNQVSLVRTHKLLVASTGRFYVVYRNTEGANTYLTVGYSDDGGVSWTEVKELDSTGKSFVASCIDSTDVVHIAYLHNTYIVSYRTFTGGALTTEENIYDGTASLLNYDNNDGTIDIAVDSENIPHVSWTQEITDGGANEVFYSNRSGGSWASRTQLSSSGNIFSKQFINIALDSNDYIYVSWIDKGGVITTVNKYTNSWQGVTNFFDLSNDVGRMAIDNSDNVYLVWRRTDIGIRYVKYTKSTESWGTITTLSGTLTSYLYPSIGVDTSNNLHLVLTSGGNIQYLTSADGAATWSSVTEIINEINQLILPRFNTCRYPIVKGVSTHIPSSGYQFIYEESFNNALKLFRSSGITLQTPVTESYSRESLAALPTTGVVLDTIFTASEHTDVATDNDVYVTQSAIDQYAIVVFKNRGTNNSDIIDVSWKGKTDIAGSTSTIFLQIYDDELASWETIASNNTVAANTEFTLSGTRSTSLTKYYDANFWVTCRVYQLAQ